MGLCVIRVVMDAFLEDNLMMIYGANAYTTKGINDIGTLPVCYLHFINAPNFLLCTSFDDMLF